MGDMDLETRSDRLAALAADESRQALDRIASVEALQADLARLTAERDRAREAAESIARMAGEEAHNLGGVITLQAQRIADLTAQLRRYEELEAEPGEPICSVTCPCCGASVVVETGEDPGQIAVYGTHPTEAAETIARLTANLAQASSDLARLTAERDQAVARVVELEGERDVLLQGAKAAKEIRKGIVRENDRLRADLAQAKEGKGDGR